MKIAILGATKGIGRAVARRLAEEGHDLCLLARDLEDAQKSAADLTTRAARKDAKVDVVPCDLEQPQTFDRALDEADAKLGSFDTVIVTAAAYGTQEQLEQDAARALKVLTTNFAHTVAFCEAARKRLLQRGGGTLCVVSSVAGDRARKPVILYGATKAGLSYYLEGLDHKYRAQGLRTVTVKPGFVRTGMTAGLPTPPFAGEPEGVAKDIVRALRKGQPVVYTPGIWRWVMLVIRNLPRFVMRRIGF